MSAETGLEAFELLEGCCCSCLGPSDAFWWRREGLIQIAETAAIAVSCCRVLDVRGGRRRRSGGADMELCWGAGDGFMGIHCQGGEEVVVDRCA